MLAAILNFVTRIADVLLISSRRHRGWARELWIPPPVFFASSFAYNFVRK